MKNDLYYLREANLVCQLSRENGNTPFGAILVGPNGSILLKQENIEITESDCTGHAETALMRNASKQFSKSFLWGCSLYTPFEPCAMCCGAIYWGNVGRVVYGVSEKRLLELTGSNEQNPTLNMPCRTIFASGQKAVQVVGPFPEFEAEAIEIHKGYW